jgi:hypothetical protein
MAAVVSRLKKNVEFYSRGTHTHTKKRKKGEKKKKGNGSRKKVSFV